MEVNHDQKSYQLVTDELALFNEEYYLSVWRISIPTTQDVTISERFNTLFAFENPDIELSVDVSEEAKGIWYYQLLVPAMLTTPDAAMRRMEKGTKALSEYLTQHNMLTEYEVLQRQEIFHYLKRYNPGVIMEIQ
ncbi:hypothetical protein B9C88_15750 [Brevibacillus laterosporus]|uniref:hypothetical protein n=1 Tax=Brevibacillus laterosporus TaxID=1465 RepID=UPI0002404DF1|nr:hypothetical protein [Brevibacillus laterosporus]PCN43384.1 hypothetical protein B9C88_15750 [Brevibacillus laterosporus]CCF14624.1 putative uncharacterized protein [Brevibacillus laterosporus GI-9]